MAAFYAGDPSASPKDAVRFLVGDVRNNDLLRTDEEIAWALTEAGGNQYLAGAIVCESLASEFAREADKTVGDQREHLSQRSAQFARRAASLRAQSVTGAAGTVAAAPHLGGASVARQDAADRDTDFPQPAFKVGQFDDPGVACADD